MFSAGVVRSRVITATMFATAMLVVMVGMQRRAEDHVSKLQSVRPPGHSDVLIQDTSKDEVLNAGQYFDRSPTNTDGTTIRTTQENTAQVDGDPMNDDTSEIDGDASIVYDTQPGPLSTLLPSNVVWKPGTTLCIQLENSKSLKLKGCGDYINGQHLYKANKPPENPILWQLSDSLLGIRAVGNHQLEQCLVPSNQDSISGGKLTLVPCQQNKGDEGDLGEEESMLWKFERVGGNHKRFGRLVHISSSLCLSQGSNFELLLLTCTKTLACAQTWSFSNHNLEKLKPTGSKTAVEKFDSRVLCWVLTQPKEHDAKATAINNTWGRYCDKLLFMTTAEHDNLETIVLDIGGPEDRGRLWNKSREAWMYTYENHLSDFDWFLKADDDTFIVWSHLQELLSTKNSSHPAYYGRPFNATRGRYYAGGSGIILSQAALKKLGDAAKTPGNYWKIWGKEKNGPEDLLTGRALARVDIDTQFNVDENGAQLFLPLGGNFEFNAKRMPKSFWFWKLSIDARAGPTCCSPHWIGVHYVPPHMMYLLDDLEHVRCDTDMKLWCLSKHLVVIF
eukprot:m.191595 g.191595  ORF g.191595 m.191595 type:complete len:561 (+) comp15647_c0_seq4:210-1892(+)